MTAPGVDPPPPGGRLEVARERGDDRRLAAAVRAGEQDAVAVGELEVDRPEGERAAPQDRAVQRDDEPRAPLGGGELEMQRRVLPRLVGHLDAGARGRR